MKKAAIAAHKTPWGRLILGIAFLAVAYFFASLAIDTGRLTYYALTIAMAIMGLRWFVLGFKRA